MIDIERTQARLEEIKSILDWQSRLIRAGMPHVSHAVIFELRLEAGHLEQLEQIWITQAMIDNMLVRAPR